MRKPVRLSLGLSLAAALGATLALPGTPASAASTAPLQPYLAEQLSDLRLLESATVLVHGESLQAAKDAVEASGMKVSTSFDKIGVVVARGTKAQITDVRRQPGVTYVEGNQPIEFSQYTSNKATRGQEALSTLTGADGSRLDGSGVSVGVIDSGVDPNHPYFAESDGSSAVVANKKVACDPFEVACQVVDAGPLDTDTLAAGGHGTHVNGIVAGREVTAGGQPLHGAAPGANLVSLSTGAVLFIIGADAALNWVLENHAAPCGEGVSAAECPPIKVTNNSYGPSGGGSFDPNSATVKLQRALADEGVVTVWAAGNDGGNGSEALTNPPGQDPTPGIVSVASYNDLETGTRDGELSDFSSRGEAGKASTYPDIFGAWRHHHLVVPPLPADLQHRSRPRRRRRLQHDQWYVDGGSAHRRHRGPAVRGLAPRDPGADRERSEVDGPQVHLRRPLPGRHLLRQGCRTGRRRGRGQRPQLTHLP